MIRLSIKIKVLLLLITLTIVMIVGMAFSMQIGFNKGFFNYRKALDKQFNDNLVQTLESYYQQQGSWNDLKNHRSLWRDLINQSAVESQNESPFRQPPPRLPKRKPPGHKKESIHEDHNNSSHQKFRTQQLPPISLFDSDKNLIMGKRLKVNDKVEFLPIVLESKAVGYLGLAQFNNVHFKQDRKFADNIKKMLIKLGLLMILIAFIISFPIAKYFTRLVNQITQGTKRVAAGDYSCRINTNRKDELGELAAHFNLLAQSLESSSESQKRIIADVAHELRTPISVIMGEIEAIQDGIHEANENTMDLLHSQISSLKNLVNDLHDLSESDLGSLKYQMQKIDMTKLLEQCYNNHLLRFSQNNISLSLETAKVPCFILGDANRLIQLFNNVLSNSMQYTDKNGKALIDMSFLNDCLEIKISDSSPSLNADQFDKIFDRLYRGEKSRNKNSGGSGLGLSIGKEIVKAHNGTISAKQSELGGVEILIRFPKAPH